MTLRAWMPTQPGEEFEMRLRSQLPGSVDLHVGLEPPSPASQSVLIAGRPTPEQLAASPDLERVIIPWAGLPPQTRDLLSTHPELAVHNLHHNAAPTAELAVALLLAAAREVPAHDRALREGDWSRRYAEPDGLLLDGASVLVLGYGSIGRRVGRACAGLGMKVHATRKHVNEAQGVEPTVELHPPEALHELLPGTDVLMVCLPDTDDTRGLLGTEEFALLPTSAIVVNVGRGAVIDEEALYFALKDGQIGAAGLDVWWSYPASEGERTCTPPSRFPFGELDRVVMSPHRAGHCGQTTALRAEHLATLLGDIAEGRPPATCVDLDLGY